LSASAELLVLLEINGTDYRSKRLKYNDDGKQNVPFRTCENQPKVENTNQPGKRSSFQTKAIANLALQDHSCYRKCKQQYF